MHFASLGGDNYGDVLYRGPLTIDMDFYKRFVDYFISIDVEERFNELIEDFELQASS